MAGLPAAAASSPFSADPECMALALRIIKDGVPEFTDMQRRRIIGNPASRDRLQQVEQCRKTAPKQGIEFGCYIKAFLPQEHAVLRKCWTKHGRSHAACLDEIYTTCDKLKQSWDSLLLSAAPSYVEL